MCVLGPPRRWNRVRTRPLCISSVMYRNNVYIHICVLDESRIWVSMEKKSAYVVLEGYMKAIIRESIEFWIPYYVLFVKYGALVFSGVAVPMRYVRLTIAAWRRTHMVAELEIKKKKMKEKTGKSKIIAFSSQIQTEI